MDIQRAKEEIKQTVRAYLACDDTGAPLIPPVRQRPILLMGPPGVGKTQIMEQIAQECGIALVAYTITHHTRQSAVGLPFIRERNYAGKTRSVTEYTMSEIIASVYAAMERTGKQNGILFIDEINCVSETLAPTMLQFLQYKVFGRHRVPDGWIVVTAGNPPEYNKSVREFDLVTLDRVRRIDIEPKLSVWQEYARAHRLHPAVTAYLELRPQHFYKIENDVDGVQFVTARGRTSLPFCRPLTSWTCRWTRESSANTCAIPRLPGTSPPTGCCTASIIRITASRIFCRASPLMRWWSVPSRPALTSASVWSACCWRA